MPTPAAAQVIHWRKKVRHEHGTPLDELPDDLTLIVDKLLDSLDTAHSRAEVQRERVIQQGFLLV